VRSELNEPCFVEFRLLHLRRNVQQPNVLFRDAAIGQRRHARGNFGRLLECLGPGEKRLPGNPHHHAARRSPSVRARRIRRSK